ncbi:ArsC/Spx/MgsR family protein [Marinicauda pacifica]|jgi:arsenate reductase|uniref:ArsC/Spx/MgsR family protein n=1 Tax=Marinicauda pacifica TaxID=1133559 RepID=UPI0035C835E6
MADLKMYGLKTCDTCRRARKALETAGREVDFTDLREMDDLPKRLPVWIEKVGADRLLNKASTTWRNLPEGEKAMAQDRTGYRALLQANPALIKRPVIVDGDAIYAGWKSDVQNALGV